MTAFRKARLFIRYPLRRKLLLFEATLILLIVRPLANVPIKRWARFLGTPNEETSPDLDPTVIQQVRDLSWAINTMSRYVFWRADCLPQAFAARWMLGRRGIPTTFYLGAAFNPEKTSLRAHAWVRAGRVIVTGRQGMRGYHVVSKFGAGAK